jgi:hypothetical protein
MIDTPWGKVGTPYQILPMFTSGKKPHPWHNAYNRWRHGYPISLDLRIEIPDIEEKFLWLLLNTEISLTNPGFETGDFTGWTTSGSPTVIGTDPKEGSYHMRANISAGGAVRAHQTYSSADTVFTRFFVQRKSSTYDSHNLEVALLTDGGPPGTRAWGFFLRFSNDEFRIEVPHSGGTIYQNLSDTATVDTWFCIEVKWVKSATVGGYQAWIDSTSRGSDFTRDTTASTPDTILMGNTGTWQTTGDQDLYFDIIAMDDASQIGCTLATAIGNTSRHIYDIEGWSGKVSGVTDPAKVMQVAVANIAKVHGVS